MENLQEIIKKKTSAYINVNNDNKLNIVTNVKYNSNKENYALDKSHFKPNTPEAACAIEIAETLNDTENFAFHREVVGTVGCGEAKRILSVVNDDIRRKKGTKYAIRNPAAYYAWLYTKLHKKEAK